MLSGEFCFCAKDVHVCSDVLSGGCIFVGGEVRERDRERRNDYPSKVLMSYVINLVDVYCVVRILFFL